MDPTVSAEPDFIDKVRLEWASTYPDVDTSSDRGLLGRITRIISQALHRLDRALGPSGVSRAEFRGALRTRPQRAPAPCSEVTAVTMVRCCHPKHADRLVKLGLVARERFERDGRVVLLRVTDAGRAMVTRNFRAGSSGIGNCCKDSTTTSVRSWPPPSPDRPKFPTTPSALGIRLAPGLVRGRRGKEWFGERVLKCRKAPTNAGGGLPVNGCSAVSYSPTPCRVQYHRRWRA